MKSKTLKKSLSIFLSVLMLLSVFGTALPVLKVSAAITGVPTRTDAVNQTWYSDSTLYGAEKWNKTTDLAALTFAWNAYSSSLGYDPQPGTLTFTYPSHMYLNVGETLEAAGYMGHMTASYGENEGDATDFRVMLSSATWGESTRAGFSPISQLISNYGHQGTVTEGTKLMTGSSSHYDFSNDGRGSDQIISNKSGDNENFLSDKESVVVWRSNIKLTSPGLTNFDEYVLLTGTASKTGEVTFQPTVYGTDNFTIGAAQRYTSFVWHSDNGTRFNRWTMNNGSRPECAPAEDALSITVTVYDKSELNLMVTAAQSYYNQHGTYEGYDALTSLGVSASEFTNRVDAAVAVLADREVSQAEIDAAASAIGDKMTVLVGAHAPDYDANAVLTPAYGTTAFFYNTEEVGQYSNLVYSPAQTSAASAATDGDMADDNIVWTQTTVKNYIATWRWSNRLGMAPVTVAVYDGVNQDSRCFAVENV